jgi:hypothetical protein
MLSTMLDELPGPARAGTTLALLWATLKKIGFPGWPDPNLDSGSGFGASIIKRGLAPAPFLLFWIPSFIRSRRPENLHLYSSVVLTWDESVRTISAKKERPVGVPAARAWGWRERNLKSTDCAVERCAREQHCDRQEQC